MKVDRVLREFVEECKKRFGENLVSVVLFGSYARGEQKKTSDLDLLVVVKDLPMVWSERKKQFEEICESLSKKYGKFIEVIPITTKELRKNLNKKSPFFITFVLGHKIVFDDGTFKKEFEKFSLELSKKNFVYYEGGRKWEIKKEALKYLH
ncbi:MAG: nucleotidyltransferase domain-containing protein [Candidatus Aenigmarchaeota archaeon]|nr:nucleotidyltransferase domain-containing protein [Candidatus Aenigmarchaeota archaeon]MCX8191023.1 nucleotidyltransferase domain-containing protein [Candidatus Aenigmarchaeota archaeon]MDW8160321.1 nucleotidyltransferase domain-containing protein [Candidatus Aenigmarchaeota archaeon]